MTITTMALLEPAPPTPLRVLAKAARIERRPRRADEICAYLRVCGWRYDPSDRLPWHRGPVAIASADEALSLELGERRMELR